MTKDDFLEYAFQDRCYFPAIKDTQSIPGIYRHAEEQPSVIIWDISKEDLTMAVIKSDFPGQTVQSFSTFTDGFKTPLHQHDHIELLYVIQGSFSQNIAGRDYHFQENDVALVNHNILHCDYLHAEDTCVLFLSMTDAFFSHLFQNSIHSPYKNFIADLLLSQKSTYTHIYGSLKAQPTDGGNPKTLHSLQEITFEISHPQPGSMHIIKGQILRLFYNLILEYRFHLSASSEVSMRRLLFDEIVSDIRRDPGGITIEVLQNKYYYNRDYFNRLIKDISGYTFQELRRNIRLEEAKRLLLETDSRIEDISFAVGYKNLGFFYRQFAEKYQKTPRQFRLSEL